VVVVEGERCADAAGAVFPFSTFVTSPGGASAAAKADWSMLQGREVFIWPDLDKPGLAYAEQVAGLLCGTAKSIQIIDVQALARTGPEGEERQPKKGWDLADALEEGWKPSDLRAKALGLMSLYVPPHSEGAHELLAVDAACGPQENDGKNGDPSSSAAHVEGAGSSLPIKPNDAHPEEEAGPADCRAHTVSPKERTRLSFGEFEMTSKGLLAKKQDSNDKIWICAPFEILGRGRNPDGQAWGRLLRWQDEDGREHTDFVSDAALHGDLTALASELAQRGLKIAATRTARSNLATYLNGVWHDERITMVARTGWHVIAEKRTFVLPNGTIGPASQGQVLLQQQAASPYQSRGTLEAWQSSVGTLIADHHRLVLMCSVAFAGPLLDLAGLEGGGVHIYGDSSLGKTTSLAPAASVWGKGASPGFILPWRQTANAFEATAALHTDTVLVFDEVGVADAKAIGTAAYQISAGAGKGRLNRDATLKGRHEWRVMLLSTGELPIAGKIAQDTGRSAQAGQQVRVLDIPADAGEGYGVFSHPGPDGNAGTLSDRIKQAAAETYGMAGPAFVQQLVQNGAEGTAEPLHQIIDAFVQENVPAGANGQVRRAARRFALIGAAGELAQTWGIVPWDEGAALDAAAKAYEDWIATRGGMGSAESGAQVAQVRRFIEAFGESRFDPIPALADVRPRPQSSRMAARAR
jgi:uncharacterized protein (DUF927 family)